MSDDRDALADCEERLQRERQAGRVIAASLNAMTADTPDPRPVSPEQRDVERMATALQRVGALSRDHMTYHDFARALLAELQRASQEREYRGPEAEPFA